MARLFREIADWLEQAAVDDVAEPILDGGDAISRLTAWWGQWGQEIELEHRPSQTRRVPPSSSDCTPAANVDRYPVFWLELEGVMAKKKTTLDKAMGKGEILAELAASTELPKKVVGRVLDELAALIERHIAKRSVGTFTLPGLLKVKVVQSPARPARQGVPNPFRPGETMDVAARPARRKVKVLPLKQLKAMIG